MCSALLTNLFKNFALPIPLAREPDIFDIFLVNEAMVSWITSIPDVTASFAFYGQITGKER